MKSRVAEFHVLSVQRAFVSRTATVAANALCAFTLVMAAMTPLASSATPPADVQSRQRLLDRGLSAIVDDAAHPLASLSVLAIRDGKPVYQGQFGFRRIDATGVGGNQPANADTMYRIASISKLITTLGVMRLVDDGVLSLDADVGNYLGYPLRNPHFPRTPITMRMLLTHRASITDEAGYYWEDRLNVNLKDVFTAGGAHYGKGEMWSRKAAPGDYFQYGNLNWGVIATVMERVSGERFDRLMKRLLFDSLGIRGGFNPAEMSAADIANIATLYRKRADIQGKEVWNPRGPWVAQVDDYSQTAPVPRAGPGYVIGRNGTLFGPQGACRLSVADLGKVMLLLMNEGTHEGRRVLSTASVREMLKRQWRADGVGGNGDVNSGGGTALMNAWGLGNQHFLDVSGVARGDRLVDGGGFTAVGHLGDAWGLRSAFVFDPKTKNGMIFLTGGPGFDPATTPGSYSALYRYEERILGALYRHALR